jgi:hypothetical protein
MIIKKLLILGLLTPNLALAQGLSADNLSYRTTLATEYMALNPTQKALANSVGTLKESDSLKQAFNMVNYALLDRQGAELMAEVFTADEIKALLAFQKSAAGQRILLKMPEYQKIMGSKVQEELRKAYEAALNPLAGVLAPTAPVAKPAPAAVKPAAPKPLGTGLGSPIKL